MKLVPLFAWPLPGFRLCAILMPRNFASVEVDSRWKCSLLMLHEWCFSWMWNITWFSNLYSKLVLVCGPTLRPGAEQDEENSFGSEPKCFAGAAHASHPLRVCFLSRVLPHSPSSSKLQLVLQTQLQSGFFCPPSSSLSSGWVNYSVYVTFYL